MTRVTKYDITMTASDTSETDEVQVDNVVSTGEYPPDFPPTPLSLCHEKINESLVLVTDLQPA